MNNYPDLSKLDSDSASDLVLQQMFVVSERTPKPWELTLPEPTESTQLSDGSWAYSWGTGPSILLAHGYQGSHTQFAHILQAILACGYKAIALEMPGHGRSRDLRADPLSFSNTVFAASTAFGEFDTMIGHSQGANAILYAAAYGVVTKKLILLAPLISVEAHLRRLCESMKLSNQATELFLNKVTKLVGAPPLQFEAAHLYAKSTLPTLLIHDQKDREIPINEVKVFAEQFNNIDLHISNGFGHSRILAEPEIAQRITSFLNNSSSIDTQN